MAVVDPVPTGMTFTRAGSPLTESMINAAERRIGVQFPNSYRAFLLHTNGGVPNPGFFLYNHTDDGRVWSWVDSYNIIDETPLSGTFGWVVERSADGTLRDVLRTSDTKWGPRETEGMDWSAIKYKWMIPDDALVIGSAGGGDCLVYFHRGPREDQVYYLIWGDRIPGDPESGLHKVGDSLAGFLANLKPDPG